jgi:hypothetical protein
MLVSRFGFSWRAVSLGEAAVVVLVVDYRYPFCLCVYLYIWRDVRLGPDHRVYWRGRGWIFFWRQGSRRRVAVGGVGDGETGSISLYKGNLNKLDVLFFDTPTPHHHHHAIEKWWRVINRGFGVYLASIKSMGGLSLSPV